MSSRVRVALVRGERVFMGAEVLKHLRAVAREKGVFLPAMTGVKHQDCRAIATALGDRAGELKIIREARGTRKTEWKRLLRAWAWKASGKKQVLPEGLAPGIPEMAATPAQVNRAFRAVGRAGRRRFLPIDEGF